MDRYTHHHAHIQSQQGQWFLRGGHRRKESITIYQHQEDAKQAKKHIQSCCPQQETAFRKVLQPSEVTRLIEDINLDGKQRIEMHPGFPCSFHIIRNVVWHSGE